MLVTPPRTSGLTPSLSRIFDESAREMEMEPEVRFQEVLALEPEAVGVVAAGDDPGAVVHLEVLLGDREAERRHRARVHLAHRRFHGILGNDARRQVARLDGNRLGRRARAAGEERGTRHEGEAETTRRGDVHVRC